MATKIATLKKRAEFLATAATGKKWITPNLILQLGKANGLGAARFGLTASGKVGNAVVRNRARRRLRALAVELIGGKADPSFDYVLIARPSTATCEAATLRHDLTTALQRLKVWRE